MLDNPPTCWFSPCPPPPPNVNKKFQGLQGILGDNVSDYCVRTLILEVTFLNSAAEGEEGLTKEA